MVEKQIIDGLISSGPLAEALEALDANITEAPCDAQWWYLRGKVRWRQGDRAMAITDYEQAVALDADSPAATALEMARSIMDFYNPDLLNP